MPIQIDQKKFIQFRYNPDYLQYGKWRNTITDPCPVTSSIGIQAFESDLVLDGGNVVRGDNWVILTEKVFVENRNQSHKAIIDKLESALEAKPIIIPCDPEDFTGHADGLVRHYDENTVLINSYAQRRAPDFHKKLKQVLKNEGLRAIEVPYNPFKNVSYSSAKGIYINYLQMKSLIVLPMFDLPEDDVALRLFEQLFPGATVRTINANQIAKDGGVLNCITWNITLIPKNQSHLKMHVDPWKGNGPL